MDRKIILIAHNIRSLWNVGSLFRTCDAFAVEKVFLTGYTALPPRREISKTALGAEENIEWEHAESAQEVIGKLQKDGWNIVGLEITDSSEEVSKYNPNAKICLLIGHEVTGIPDEQLQLCDDVIHIPMHGVKESLNVSVATGIALHHLRESM